MKVEPGHEITVRHYSMLNVFKSNVLDVQQDSTILIKLPKDCLGNTFLKGDPVVVAYETSGIVEIKGGSLSDFDPINEHIAFTEEKQDEGMRMRSYERFPVSLYADLKPVTGSRNAKSFVRVKDISEYGVGIYAKESFFKGQRFDLDIFLTRDILSLTADIVRKIEIDNFFEYGLKIVHSGPTVFNHIKNFVRKSQQEYTFKSYKE